MVCRTIFMVFFANILVAYYWFFYGFIHVHCIFLFFWAFMFMLQLADSIYSLLFDLDIYYFYVQFCNTFSSYAQFLEFALLVFWWPFFFLFLLPIMSAHTGGLSSPNFCIVPGQVFPPDPLRSGWIWFPLTNDGLHHRFSQASDLQVHNNLVAHAPVVLPPANGLDANGNPVFFGPQPQPLPLQLNPQLAGQPNQS